MLKKHLLGLEETSPDEITQILNSTEAFKEVLSVPLKKSPPFAAKPS